jgi:hypothetical protein
MPGLNDTFSGRVILDELNRKYGTKDPEILLKCVVLDHFTDVFPLVIRAQMAPRMAAASEAFLREIEADSIRERSGGE